MAYHNIRTPVFYCNMLEYLDRHGLIQHASGNSSERIYMNFQRMGLWATAGNSANNVRTVYTDIPISDWLGSKCFYAILGHNGDNAGAKVRLQYFGSGQSYQTISKSGDDLKVIVNGNISSETNTFPYDGWSLCTFNGDDLEGNRSIISFRMDATSGSYAHDLRYGAIAVGNYFEAPSTDLNVSISTEMDGIKSIRTKGGYELTDYQYTRGQNWVYSENYASEIAAWELATGENNLTRQGRRLFDISWSYLADSDVFPELSNHFPPSGYDYDLDDQKSLLVSSTLAGILEYSMGGTIPILFQYSSDNNAPDNFALVKIDSKSVKITQQSAGLYKVNLKLREVW